MYSKFISKMTAHFSKLGSIIYSKSCDFYNRNPISKDDIMMYYELLNSKNVDFPNDISKKNHIGCCLYYLSKDNSNFKDIFLDMFLKDISIDALETSEENLILIFNIIEFDKTYLHSEKAHIYFLYQLLRSFSNFPTNFENFIIYKLYRGYIKFRVGDYESTNKEHFEIITELSDNKENNYLLKYLKIKNGLLKLKLYTINRKPSLNKAENNEYWQFLRELYEEVQRSNNFLALKIGFDLFSSYFECKSYFNCIPLLESMKKLLKKEILKGATMRDGIDFYLAIASRLGYVGILLGDKKAITSAIKKIRKALNMIKDEKSLEKIKQLTNAYNFILAILEISLNKKTDFDIKVLASDFKDSFLPELTLSNKSLNYLVNEKNKDSSIIDLRIINNMNSNIEKVAKDILNKSVEQIQKKNYSNSLLFLNFILAIHDKVNQYCNSYISDENPGMQKLYKDKIKNYTEGAINFVYKLLDDEPLLNTKFVKGVIIDILSAYTHVFIYEKDWNMIRKEIGQMDDLKRKLSIEDDLPENALINKIKGDFWFYKGDYKAAVNYYENALKFFVVKDPKIPPVLFNNGCAHFFNGNKQKAIQNISKSIVEYSNLLKGKNFFGFTPNVDKINEKIDKAKQLLNQIS